MENKDFDKIFKNRFEQIPGEPYRESNWSGLSGRLDACESKRRRRMLFAIWPLFVLMAAGNVFWWHQWRQADNQLHTGGAPTQKTVVYDTVFHRTVIYDTVYQHTTHIIRNGIYTDQPWNSPKVVEKNGERPNAFENTSGPVKVSGKTPVQEVSNGMTVQETFQPGLVHSTSTPLQTGHTTSHAVPLPDSLLQADTTLDNAKKPDLIPLLEELQHARPDIVRSRQSVATFASPRVNISAGWANPLLSHKRSGALFGIGLGGDVQVAKNLRLAADVQYWRGKMKAEETEELKGVDIPQPGADYKLRYWETYRLPAISYDLQLRYYFQTNSAWKPWIGLGAQWNTTLPFEIEFDYENQNSYYEVFIPGQTRAITSWQGLIGTVGLERSLNKHFSFSANAFLLQHPGRNAGLLGKQFGLRSRLFYRF